MNATLNFRLPEEQVEYELASHGGDWSSVVWELDTWLREKLKYGHEFKSADQALEETRQFLTDEMIERSLQFPP